MVGTPGGGVRIDSLLPGDLVTTPMGPRPVLFVAHKRTNAVRLRLGGRYIDCTPDHKFYTFNRGWVEGVKLCATDVLSSETSWLSRAATRLLSCLGENSGFKGQVDASLQEERELLASVVKLCSTVVSGFTSMAQSRKAQSFTTLTAIGETIAQRTLRSRTGRSTEGITCSKRCRTLIMLSAIKRACSWLRNPPSCGIPPRKELRGILSTLLPWVSGSQNHVKQNATVVEGCTPSAVPNSGISVAPSAAKIEEKPRVPSTPGSTGKSSRVLWAAARCVVRRCSISLLARNARLRPANCSGPLQLTETDVFCPTLGSVNAFYAEGVLTQNCADAMVLSLWIPGGMYRKTRAVPQQDQRLTLSLLNAGSFGGKY